mmetsp:Transcript_23730/g.58164  ORF Transcript_23730/g.58164 Transcript_23730/m.58164 type:complete len:89 (-) Transcript_23730:192-458(-)
MLATDCNDASVLKNALNFYPQQEMLVSAIELVKVVMCCETVDYRSAAQAIKAVTECESVPTLPASAIAKLAALARFIAPKMATPIVVE